jgi:uncharacterized protein (TIGR00251 family)
MTRQHGEKPSNATKEKKQMDYTALLLGKKRVLIHAKPNARKTEILDYNADGDFFTVAVAAPPEDGKANREIERCFVRITGRAASVKAGQASKKKVLALY